MPEENTGQALSFEAALRLLVEGVEAERESAAARLRELGDPRVEQALIAALEDPSPFVRLAVAYSLSAVGGPAAVPALVKAAQDEDEEVVDNADLTHLSDARIPEAVRAGLQDPSASVRRRAALTAAAASLIEPWSVGDHLSDGVEAGQGVAITGRLRQR